MSILQKTGLDLTPLPSPIRQHKTSGAEGENQHGPFKVKSQVNRQTVSQNVRIHYAAGTGMPNTQFQSDECGSD